MHAPGIPRFVRGHIYKISSKETGSPQFVGEFVRARKSYFKDEIFLVFRSLVDLHGVHAQHLHPRRVVAVKREYISDGFDSRWTVEELTVSELPLYIGMRTTKYFEQVIKRSLEPRKVRGRPKPNTSNGL